MLAKHVAFLRERRWADEVRYPWQTRERFLDKIRERQVTVFDVD